MFFYIYKINKTNVYPVAQDIPFLRVYSLYNYWAYKISNNQIIFPVFLNILISICLIKN